MHLEHAFTLPVGIDQAWRVLRDIGSIAPSMPGSTIALADADSVEGSLKVKLGPLNATYRGSARLVSADPATRIAVVEATGDTTRSGSASATVTATLRRDGDATTVTLATDLEVTGKPAQFGQAVMSDVGTKLVTQFATRLSEALTAGTWNPTTPTDGAVEPAPPTEPTMPAEPAQPAAEVDPEAVVADEPADAAAGPDDVPAQAPVPAEDLPEVDPAEADTAEVDPPAATPADEPVAADQPIFAAPSAPVPPAPSGSGQTIPSVNGHGSPDPVAAHPPAGATHRDLNAVLRPFLVRGVAPLTIAAVIVLGRFRRRRRRH